MEIEKGLLKKGVLSSEYVGIQLPKIRVTWQQNKQGKGKNKAEKNLSLNKLPAFQENGCLVCTVEAVEGSCQNWAPSGKRSTKRGYAGGHLAAPALCLSCTMGGQLIVTALKCSNCVR
jgi:hypothetical protein